MDRGARQATAHWGPEESDMTEQLSLHFMTNDTAIGPHAPNIFISHLLKVLHWGD